MKVAPAATNLADLLRRQAALVPERPALLDGDRVVTWAGLDDEVDRLASGLAAKGFIAGHRVAVMLDNSVEFITAYLATLRAGMVAVPVNPASTTGETARVLADSGARICFADASTIQTVRSAAGGIADALDGAPDDALAAAVVPGIVTVGVPTLPAETSYADLAAPDNAAARIVSPRDPESLAVLLYTSGTSGRPRGAMLTHRALLANIEQASATDPAPIDPEDLVLGVLPLFHVYGLNAVLGQVLRQGCTLVVGRRFRPEETLQIIEAAQVTCVPVAPPVVAAWSTRSDLAERLASVRILLSGAAPLAEDLVRRFEEKTGLSVQQGYGLTEASPIVTSTVGSGVHKPGSTGRAVPGVELRIVDDAGNDVLPDDPGEIWVRGDNVFSGYWPDGHDGPDSEGWLKTGDVGFLDSDGDLFLVDRLKELVLVSGFNVYPSEIEEVIREVDGVVECAVIGVPDELAGEAVRAYVVAADGVDPTDLVERVLAHCAVRLARFKIPSAVEAVETLPHSATGKVAKGRLRALEARRAMGLS